jgi:hypothetical protein
LAAAHPRALGGEFGDIGKLLEADLAFDDQVGAADVEIVAAAAGEVLELPAGTVVAEVEPESHPLERIEQVLVEGLRLLGEQDVGFACQRKRHGRRDQVAVLQRRSLVIERVR